MIIYPRINSKEPIFLILAAVQCKPPGKALWVCPIIFLQFSWPPALWCVNRVQPSTILKSASVWSRSTMSWLIDKRENKWLYPLKLWICFYLYMHFKCVFIYCCYFLLHIMALPDRILFPELYSSLSSSSCEPVFNNEVSIIVVVEVVLTSTDN